jgi:hypothetical protein
MKSTLFWDTTPCSPLKVNRRFGGRQANWFHVGILLGLLWWRCLPPKRRLTFNGLQGVTSQKIVLSVLIQAVKAITGNAQLQWRWLTDPDWFISYHETILPTLLLTMWNWMSPSTATTITTEDSTSDLRDQQICRLPCLRQVPRITRLGFSVESQYPWVGIWNWLYCMCDGYSIIPVSTETKHFFFPRRN